MNLRALVQNPIVMRELQKAGRNADMEKLAAELKVAVPELSEISAKNLSAVADLFWAPTGLNPTVTASLREGQRQNVGVRRPSGALLTRQRDVRVATAHERLQQLHTPGSRTQGMAKIAADNAPANEEANGLKVALWGLGISTALFVGFIAEVQTWG